MKSLLIVKYTHANISLLLLFYRSLFSKFFMLIWTYLTAVIIINIGNYIFIILFIIPFLFIFKPISAMFFVAGPQSKMVENNWTCDRHVQRCSFVCILSYVNKLVANVYLILV